MAIEFTRFPTEKQASDALFNELRRYLGEGNDYHAEAGAEDVAGRQATSPYVIMLAGGSTPQRVYQRLAAEPPRTVHPAAHLMLSDDRYVSADDDRSNFHHLRALGSALGLPESRLLHVDASRPLADAVGGFGDQIADIGERGAIFSLAVLGIGADGHTASLFSPGLVEDFSSGAVGSGRPLTSDRERLALHTGNHGGLERVSAGSAVLLSFRTVIFFATGESKRDILYQISRRPEDYPAGRIMLQHPNASIWTDEAPRVQ